MNHIYESYLCVFFWFMDISLKKTPTIHGCFRFGEVPPGRPGLRRRCPGGRVGAARLGKGRETMPWDAKDLLMFVNDCWI